MTRSFLLDLQERVVLVSGLKHCLVLSDVLSERGEDIAHRRMIRDLMRRLEPTVEEMEVTATPPVAPRRRRWAAPPSERRSP